MKPKLNKKQKLRREFFKWVREQIIKYSEDNLVDEAAATQAIFLALQGLCPQEFKEEDFPIRLPRKKRARW